MGAGRRQARWDRCESASARLSREDGKIWNGQGCGPAVAVYQELPRRLNGGQAFPSRVAFATKPVLDVGPEDECERQIGRRKVDGEVRSLVYTLDVYMSTVDSVCLICNIPGPGCWNGTMEQVKST